MPSSVQKHLSQGEVVLGKLAGKGADYYATDRRLLRFTSESQYQSLEYTHISVDSVNWGVQVTVGRVVMVVFGLFVAFAGILFLTVNFGRVVGFPGGKSGFVLVLWLLGVGAAALGASLRSSYYQIRTPGVAQNDKAWRFWDLLRWSHGADNFADILKQRSARR